MPFLKIVLTIRGQMSFLLSFEIHSGYRENSAFDKGLNSKLSVSSRVSRAAAAVCSVPGLVLMVPSVEVVVEQHDAAGRHASDDAPLRILKET